MQYLFSTDYTHDSEDYEIPYEILEKREDGGKMDNLKATFDLPEKSIIACPVCKGSPGKNCALCKGKGHVPTESKNNLKKQEDSDYE